jgi:phosphatidylinositol-3,4,5-trisphosphate 3-phosphatase/dual-specificity protein phosphatase PTEN
MLRTIVSLNKRRFVDADLRVDLDLSYITEHVIAMGFPSSGAERFYRNDVCDVSLVGH